MIDLKEIFASSEKVNVEVKAAQGGFPIAFGKHIRLLLILSVVRLFLVLKKTKKPRNLYR